MAYDIEISDDARQSFRKLDKLTAQRIYTKLKEIASSENPFIYVKRLTGIALFSLRVGDYRIILDIKRNSLIILVLKLGRRKNVYDDV
ncbi:type II toxin-antitoxin system RelE/ParE family toxin [Candidatus Marsarchaeota archaeon]|jgi:mRNA interferase RelE/StbE|nr:type II toxin-antitoxin system RelE/ParE family toxin [Candidatus Marsarchaeota archaeon]